MHRRGAAATGGRPSPCTSRSRAIQAATCCRLATMLPWVRTAPFATPVVPPVYCRNSLMSSWSIGTSSSVCARPAASAALKLTAFGMCHRGTIFFTCFTTRLVTRPLSHGNRSPTCVAMTVLIGDAGSTCCSVCAKFSSTTMAMAPESFSWYSSSRAVYIGLTLTTVRPARSTPNSATGYCSRLGSMSATRSPFRRPATFCR